MCCLLGRVVPDGNKSRRSGDFLFELDAIKEWQVALGDSILPVVGVSIRVYVRRKSSLEFLLEFGHARRHHSARVAVYRMTDEAAANRYIR